jgi:uncharacterized iron-regulated protein
MTFSRLLVGCLLASLGAGCHGAPPARAATRPAESPWLATAQASHPLVGKIFDGRDRRPVERSEVERRAAAAHFVLLGEKHDNPDHHRLQAQVLQSMLDAGRRPVVGFEMLEQGQQRAVNDLLLAHPRDPERLAAAVAWEQSGWPAWSMYRPVFKTAMDAGLPILAANIPAVQVRLLVRHGDGALPAGELQRLALDRPLPEAQHAALELGLKQSHCGMLPERVVKAMVLAQRARDAVMADRLMQADSAQGGVLLAGGEHVRADRGVPLYLSWRGSGKSTLSIAWTEVQPGVESPADYDLGADLLWFTPRVDEDDPCEKFKGQLRRAGERSP